MRLNFVAKFDEYLQSFERYCDREKLVLFYSTWWTSAFQVFLYFANFLAVLNCGDRLRGYYKKLNLLINSHTLTKIFFWYSFHFENRVLILLVGLANMENCVIFFVIRDHFLFHKRTRSDRIFKRKFYSRYTLLDFCFLNYQFGANVEWQFNNQFLSLLQAPGLFLLHVLFNNDFQYLCRYSQKDVTSCLENVSICYKQCWTYIDHDVNGSMAKY